jgi:hypothetical protein
MQDDSRQLAREVFHISQHAFVQNQGVSAFLDSHPDHGFGAFQPMERTTTDAMV